MSTDKTLSDKLRRLEDVVQTLYRENILTTYILSEIPKHLTEDSKTKLKEEFPKYVMENLPSWDTSLSLAIRLFRT